jgi:GAF domain-containing protein
MVSRRPRIRFYAAARLRVQGETVEALCAYDIRPRRNSAGQLEHVQTLASAAVELIGRRSAAIERPATWA